MNESDTPRTDKEVRNRGERFKLAALQAVSADFARTLERRCAELTAALEQEKRINRQACVDWTDDDTAIKAACKPFGIDTEGDSYGVPTMVDCVLQLAARCAELDADKAHYIESLAKGKRPFSSKLADAVIAEQVKTITRLEEKCAKLIREQTK